MPLYAAAFVIIIGVIDVLGSLFIERKILTDEKKLYTNQIAMKRANKEFAALQKEKGLKHPDTMQKQNEVMNLSFNSMKISMPAMIASIVIFFAVYYVVLPFLYKMVAPNYVDAVFPLLGFKLNFHLLFWVTIFAVGIIGAIFIQLRDRKNVRKLESELGEDIKRDFGKI